MMTRPHLSVKSSLRILFIGLLIAPVAISAAAEGDWNITPLEAIHLVERQVPRFGAELVEKSDAEGAPLYRVRGAADGKPIEALVDARVARVTSIRGEGSPIYEWRGIVVAGHRATVKFAPENTLAAIEKAIEHGADLLEIDIRQTSDGRLVVLHDFTVNRTTDGKGAVSRMTLEEVRRLDAGSWFNEKFADEGVPTLREALTAMKGTGPEPRALPDIDFKAGDPEKLVALLEEFGMHEGVTLYCTNWDLMKRTLRLAPKMIARPTARRGSPGLPNLLETMNPPVVNIDWPAFTERLVLDIHLAGKKAFVNCMGPNDTPLGMQLAIDAGADYIQTDHLDVLLPLLRKQGLHE